MSTVVRVAARRDPDDRARAAEERRRRVLEDVERSVRAERDVRDLRQTVCVDGLRPVGQDAPHTRAARGERHAAQVRDVVRAVGAEHHFRRNWIGRTEPADHLRECRHRRDRAVGANVEERIASGIGHKLMPRQREHRVRVGVDLQAVRVVRGLIVADVGGRPPHAGRLDLQKRREAEPWEERVRGARVTAEADRDVHAAASLERDVLRPAAGPANVGFSSDGRPVTTRACVPCQ